MHIKPPDLLSEVVISTVFLCLSIAAFIVVTCDVLSTIPEIGDYILLY